STGHHASVFVVRRLLGAISEGDRPRRRVRGIAFRGAAAAVGSAVAQPPARRPPRRALHPGGARVVRARRSHALGRIVLTPVLSPNSSTSAGRRAKMPLVTTPAS